MTDQPITKFQELHNGFQKFSHTVASTEAINHRLSLRHD